MDVLGKPIVGQGTAKDIVAGYVGKHPVFTVDGTEGISDLALNVKIVEPLKLLARKYLAEGKGIALGEALEGQVDILEHLKVSGKPFYTLLAEEFPTLKRTEALVHWLLRVAVCYVEVPSTRVMDTYSFQGYTKFLATSNYDLAVEWVKDSGEVAIRNTVTRKFLSGTYLAGQGTATVNGSVLSADGTTPYVKLSVNRKTGLNSIVNPRTVLDIKPGTRILPLFLMQEVADYILEQANKGYISVNFLKDGGQKRKIVTTNRLELLESVYGEYLGQALEESISGRYEGNFFNYDTVDRGYVRMVSVGESYFEDSLTRSVSLSRVLGTATDGVEPDISTVAVNTRMVLPVFNTALTRMSNENNIRGIEEVISNLKDFGLADYTFPPELDNVNSWVDRSVRVGGTGFILGLASFMMALPGLFPEYKDVYQQEGTTEEHPQGTADFGYGEGGLF